MTLPGLKLRCLQGRFFAGDWRREPNPLPFQYLDAAAHTPVVAPRSFFKASSDDQLVLLTTYGFDFPF